MDARKILIADGNEEFRQALAEALQGSFYIRSCKDGHEALALLRSFCPDILVLDLLLPGLDGISLLHFAVNANICPMVLATAKFLSQYMTDVFDCLQVDYFMMKPCDIQATVDRIHDLSQRIRRPLISQPDPRNYITGLLVNLGVPPKLDGYSYLREAILLIAKQREQSITKELYPAVAVAFGNNTNGKNVERSIRNAIEKAWLSRDDRIWKRYFQPDRDGNISKPTNAEFIHRLADSLILRPAEDTDPT